MLLNQKNQLINQRPQQPQYVPQRTSPTKGGQMASVVSALKQELKVTPQAQQRLIEKQRMGQSDQRFDKIKGLIDSM